MRIGEQKIEEVRSASDIVDVISGYVKLKKRGKNFLGLCPFHTEKTPSFNVSPERQMYHCFGCGVGGNVFTFVMEHDKVSFVEAVRTLAERAGISLPEETSSSAGQVTENESLYNICRIAGRFFYDNMTTTIEGKLAYEYFKHRGFSEETVRAFGLGYSMNGWDTLLKYMELQKLELPLVEKAGLLVKREDAMPVQRAESSAGRQGSGYYDRFRGRAMFPIFSVAGRVIGFGARKIREDDPVAGKYINSPETPIYDKSRSLYGIFQAKETIREKEFAILVEGYADLISVYQAGITNVVASSGTALTEQQIELIGRYAKNITLVYDADSAGSKATTRGVDLIIEQGLDVKVATLPEGADPDSFVRNNGGHAFQKLVDEAVSFLDFKAGLFQSQGLLETPEGQANAVRSFVETLAKMKDELKRSFYIKRIAERYGIYESVLYRELEQRRGKERTREHFAKQRETEAQTSDPEPLTVSSLAQHSGSPPVAERDLLKLMLEHGNAMVNYVFSHILLDEFTHPEVRRALDVIIPHTRAKHEWDPNTLMNEIDDAALRRFLADITFSQYELSKGWKELDAMPEEVDPGEIAERCMVLMKKQGIEKRLAENQRQMKEASTRGEDVRQYVDRHQSLMKEKKGLEIHGLVAPS